jgi:hypothetical protein
VVAFHVAATVVTLMQYLRVKEPRLLPLLALFASLAAAHTLGEWDPWGRAFHLTAGFAGLVLLFVLSPRQPPAPTARPEG